MVPYSPIFQISNSQPSTEVFKRRDNKKIAIDIQLLFCFSYLLSYISPKGQPCLRHPGRADTPEYVQRAGIVPVIIIVRSTNNDIAAVDRDSLAEEIVLAPIRGGQFGLLLPALTFALEYIRRAGFRTHVIIHR